MTNWKDLIPAHACDSHIHIVDSRFAPNYQPKHGHLQYQTLQKNCSLERAVVVIPKTYGLNNDGLIDAIRQLGAEKTRGIAVISPETSDRELERLHAAGIRGIRFSVWNTDNAVVSLDTMELLSHRIRDLGWHIQVHMSGAQLIEHEALLNRLACPLVIDHMGRFQAADPVHHPAFTPLCRLLDKGKTWVKISGIYRFSVSGPPSEDAHQMCASLIKNVPERLVWGSDWPHMNWTKYSVDSEETLRLFLEWVTDETIRHQILVRNPERLYDFPSEKLPN